MLDTADGGGGGAQFDVGNEELNWPEVNCANNDST